MNRRELARTGILGLCGFLLGAIPEKKVTYALIRTVAHWEGDGKKGYNLKAPDGTTVITYLHSKGDVGIGVSDFSPNSLLVIT